jgi:hypothetical protein
MKYFINVAYSYDSTVYSTAPYTATNTSLVSRRYKLAWRGRKEYAHINITTVT